MRKTCNPKSSLTNRRLNATLQASTTSSKRLKNYIRSNGRSPFEDWILSLRDKPTIAKIFTKIDRLRFGNFGDCKSVGDGVFELRLHFGPGYRVYFGASGSDLIILLLGGDKSSQGRDIKKAQSYWREFLNG